jgi:hypothetical protein
MKIKRYDGYISEERDDEYDDEYYGYEEDDDNDESSDDVEHLFYLLRKYLRDAGVNGADIKGDANSIKMEVVMRKKEKMSDVISVFATLRKISEEILADYDCDFDIWKNKKGEPLLIIDYYAPDADDDEDGVPF